MTTETLTWTRTTWPYDAEYAKTCECYTRKLGRGRIYLHRSLECKDGPSWSCTVSFGRNSDLSHTAGVANSHWDTPECAQLYVDTVIVPKIQEYQAR